MIVRSSIGSGFYLSETPRGDEAAKALIHRALLKVKRHNEVFKDRRLQQPPRPSVRVPCNNIMELILREHRIQLDRESLSTNRRLRCIASARRRETNRLAQCQIVYLNSCIVIVLIRSAVVVLWNVFVLLAVSVTFTAHIISSH